MIGLRYSAGLLRRVSWSLVVFTPPLLMLVTVGLSRLEAGLTGHTVSAEDVAEFLQQAGSDDVDTLVRDGMSTAIDGLHRRLQGREARVPSSPWVFEQPGLPTRVDTHHLYLPVTNPEFHPTRHTNPV